MSPSRLPTLATQMACRISWHFYTPGSADAKGAVWLELEEAHAWLLPFTTSVSQDINRNVHEVQLCLALHRPPGYKHGCYSPTFEVSHRYRQMSLVAKPDSELPREGESGEYISGLAKLTQYKVTPFQTYICHYSYVIYLESLTNEICFLSFYPFSLISVCRAQATWPTWNQQYQFASGGLQTSSTLSSTWSIFSFGKHKTKTFFYLVVMNLKWYNKKTRNLFW